MTHPAEFSANESQILTHLETLCRAVGVSGYEDEVRNIVRARLAPVVDEVRTDRLGNLIGIRRAASGTAHGNGPTPTVLIDAHMDEIGLIVSDITSGGFLRIATVGGWDARVMPAQRVRLRTRDGNDICGVIGSVPPHIQKEADRSKPVSVESLFVDIGAPSLSAVRAAGVRIGDCAVLESEAFRVQANAESDHHVFGRAFDNRIGCALALCLAENTAQHRRDFDVAYVFSTFEEVGGRGAEVATFGLSPALALVLEATVAGDVPGVPAESSPTVMGSGPAITIMDRSAHCAPAVVRQLEASATQRNIPWQHKRPIFGGTNAARIQTAGVGVLTGIISVPCRYIHSPVAHASVADITNTYRLAEAFLSDAGQLL